MKYSPHILGAFLSSVFLWPSFAQNETKQARTDLNKAKERLEVAKEASLNYHKDLAEQQKEDKATIDEVAKLLGLPTRSESPSKKNQLLGSGPKKKRKSTSHRTVANIRCSDGAIWAMEDQIIVYKGDVEFSHPEFQLTGADMLAVHAAKSEEGKEVPLQGVNKAYAEGSALTITSIQEGKPVVASCQKFHYDAKEDLLVLSGWPRLRHDGKIVKAGSPDTRIFLTPSTGQHRIDGRAETANITSDVETTP